MPGRSLGELARMVGGDLEGDPSLEIRGFASLESAAPGDLSFVAGVRNLPAAMQSAGGSSRPRIGPAGPHVEK